MRYFPNVLHRYPGFDKTPSRLIWNPSYGLHGLVMSPESLIKLSEFENLSEEMIHKIDVVHLNFCKYLDTI